MSLVGSSEVLLRKTIVPPRSAIGQNDTHTDSLTGGYSHGHISSVNNGLVQMFMEKYVVVKFSNHWKLKHVHSSTIFQQLRRVYTTQSNHSTEKAHAPPAAWDAAATLFRNHFFLRIFFWRLENCSPRLCVLPIFREKAADFQILCVHARCAATARLRARPHHQCTLSVIQGHMCCRGGGFSHLMPVAWLCGHILSFFSSLLLPLPCVLQLHGNCNQCNTNFYFPALPPVNICLHHHHHQFMCVAQGLFFTHMCVAEEISHFWIVIEFHLLSFVLMWTDFNVLQQIWVEEGGSWLGEKIFSCCWCKLASGL